MAGFAAAQPESRGARAGGLTASLDIVVIRSNLLLSIKAREAGDVVFACAVACAPCAVAGCATELQPAAPVGYTDVTYAPLPVAVDVPITVAQAKQTFEPFIVK